MLTDAERRVIELYVGNYRNDPVKDLYAVYSAMVRKGEWEEFWTFMEGEYHKAQKNAWTAYGIDKYYSSRAAWLFCLNAPEQISERLGMVVKWMERMPCA